MNPGADTYDRQYSTMKEYGLADFKDSNDLVTMFESLRKRLENLYPGFHKWLVNKGKAIFQNGIIKCARKNTNVHGLFYNNSIECQHYQEKKSSFLGKEQCVMFWNIQCGGNIQVTQNEEVWAVYRSAPYTLSDRYKRLEVHSVK